MPGPEPSENRRRRNIPVKEAQRVVLDPAGRMGRAPNPRTDEPLADADREQWRAWWRSPMATMWDSATDVYPLTRLLLLYREERLEGVDTKRSAEMRQLEGQYGLTARGRKELMWVIGAPEEPSAKPKSASPKTARRQRLLRAVE